MIWFGCVESRFAVLLFWFFGKYIVEKEINGNNNGKKTQQNRRANKPKPKEEEEKTRRHRCERIGMWKQKKSEDDEGERGQDETVRYGTKAYSKWQRLGGIVKIGL